MHACRQHKSEPCLHLTELGELVVALQIDPGIARMVYFACMQGFGETACTIAGVISVSSNFFWRGKSEEDKAAADAKHLEFSSKYGDVVSMFDAYNEWERMMFSYLDDRTELTLEEDEREKESELEVKVEVLDALLDHISVELQGEAQHLKKDAESLYEEEISSVDSDNISSVSENMKSDKSIIVEEKLDDDAQSVTSEITILLESTKLNGGKKINKFSATKNAKKWCQSNCLNNKSMGMAHSTKNDILRIVKQFNSGKLWSSFNQHSTPSPLDIQRLLVKAQFLNVSVQTRVVTEYEVIRNSASIVGVVHPSSSLMKLANSVGQGQSAEHLLTPLLVFNSMMTTSRTYLNVVTPVQEEWIREESNEFYENIFKVFMTTFRSEKICIAPVHYQTLKALFGRHNQFKDAWESDFNCSIQYNHASNSLEVWCTKEKVTEMRNFFNRQIENVRLAASNEIDERVIVGGTRAVYGAGGLIKTILFSGQYCSVNISNLPENINAVEVASIMERFGPTRLVDITSPPSQRQGDASKKLSAFARVVFENPADAARCCEELQGEVIGDNTLSIQPGGIQSSSLSSSTCTPSFLTLSWALAPSKGKCLVHMATANDANNIIALCTNGSCHVLRSLGSKVYINAALPPNVPGGKSESLFNEFVHKAPYKISLNGLHPHVDEVAIEAAFQEIIKYASRSSIAINSPIKICVYREAAPAIDDHTSLSVQTALRRECIPLSNCLKSATSFFDQKYSHRAGFYLQYDSLESTELASQEWDRMQQETRSGDDQQTWISYGQPIRLERNFQGKLFMHSALWDFFHKQFEDGMKLLLTKFGVACTIQKPRLDITPGKNHIPKTTIILKGPSSISIQSAIADLTAL